MKKTRIGNHYELQAEESQYITQIECSNRERTFATTAAVALTDENWRDATQAEKDEWEQAHSQDNTERINELKQILADTDYKAIKYAEGWYTEEEYAPIKAEREAAREEIRQLSD